MKGIFSALLVSFDEDRNINEAGLREIVRYNIYNNKVDGLYVGGSTGENFMLSTEEKKRVFEIVKDETKNKIKLIAQVGSVNLKEAIELGKYVTELGYDAISAVTPFYYKFSFEEIKDYYNILTKEVNNNLIIYSVPVLTGVNMSLKQFGELFENEKIIGVKFTQGDFYLLERIRKYFPNKLIYSGFDEMLLPALSLGIDGTIGSTYNLSGKKVREMLELAKSGEFNKALEIQHLLNDFVTDLLNNRIFISLKLLLEEKGINAGYCRKPMKEANEKEVLRAKEIFNKYLNTII